jgi:hypothetical protein
VLNKSGLMNKFFAMCYTEVTWIIFVVVYFVAIEFFGGQTKGKRLLGR